MRTASRRAPAKASPSPGSWASRGDRSQPAGDHGVKENTFSGGPGRRVDRQIRCPSPDTQAKGGKNRPQRLALAQQQESGQGGVQFSPLSRPQNTGSRQELVIREGVPGMVRLPHHHAQPELAQGLPGEDFRSTALQHRQVGGGVVPVPQHGPDLVWGTVIVPLAVPAVRAGKGAVPNVHWPLVPLCLGHGSHQEPLCPQWCGGVTSWGLENVGADLGGVLHRLPEQTYIPWTIRDAGDPEGFVPGLLHPQQDQTADGVGKGGIRSPTGCGESPPRPFWPQCGCSLGTGRRGSDQSPRPL